MIRGNLQVEDGVEYHPEDLDTGYNVVLRKGCIVGRNVKLWSGTVIDAGAVVLDGARIHCNCYIAQRCIVGRNVFMGPGVILTNDRYPMRADPETWEPVIIQNGAIIGGGVTICPGVTIGDGAMIGAGSLVTKDVPFNQAWGGNPAKRLPTMVEHRWLIMRDKPDLSEIEEQELEFYQPDERVSEVKANGWEYEYQHPVRSKQEHEQSHLGDFEAVDVSDREFYRRRVEQMKGVTWSISVDPELVQRVARGIVAIENDPQRVEFHGLDTLITAGRQPSDSGRYDPAHHYTLGDIESDALPMFQGEPMAMFTSKCRWWTTDLNDCLMTQTGTAIKCNIPCCPHCEEPVVMVPLGDFLSSMRCYTAELGPLGVRALEAAHASNLGRLLCLRSLSSYPELWRRSHTAEED